jgi:hypothetical protein
LGAPQTFDNVNDAPYLQVFGNTVIGQDLGSTGTFAIAGEGSSFSDNFVAATANPNTGLITQAYILMAISRLA